MLRLSFISVLFFAIAGLQVHAQAVNKLAARNNQQPKTTVKGKGNSFKTTTAATDTAGWTDKDREGFLRVCQPATGFNADSAGTYCHCMLQKIEKLYPIPTDADKKLTPEKARALALECLGQKTEKRTGWTNAERRDFMNDCKLKITKNLGAARIETFCSCIMQKMENAYPNPSDANKITVDELNRWTMDCSKQ